MKKLAITIAAILSSGTVYAGNTASTSLEDSNNDYVEIKQTSPGVALADGNETVVNFKYSSDNVVNIYQDGNRNSVMVDGAIPATYPTDNNEVKINQTGDDNHSYVQFKGADDNDVYVDVTGNNNQTYSYFTNYNADNNLVDIDVTNSNDNYVETKVKSASGNSENNVVDVDITNSSNGNTVYATQRGDTNRAEVTISDFSDGNSVDISQYSHNNVADIDIAGSSSYNDVDVLQVARDAKATVSIDGGSANNVVNVWQSINDVTTVTMTNAQTSQVHIWQH